MKSKVFSLLTVCCAMGLLWGCQEKGSAVEQRQPEPTSAFYQPFGPGGEIPAMQVSLPDYRLNVGDMLEIIYHVKHLVTDEYRFHTEDTISIMFPYHPEFNQTVTIPPDGTIRLMLVGEVKVYEAQEVEGETVVKGKTVGEFEQELKEKYSKFFKDNDLTVTFTAANTKIEELKRAITTAPRGQSRLMPVKPDGNITLPFIKDIRAYGKTIEELHGDLNEAYERAGLPELEVTVQILTVAPRKIFVMGEVDRPGLIEAGNMITLTQALSMAGGLNVRADKSKVMVIRRKGLPVPEGVVVDVEDILESMVTVDGKKRPSTKAWLNDFWLDDYDLVYVPPSGLTKANDWIDQVFTRGVRAVMPYSTSVGFGFGYQLYNAPQSVRTQNGNGLDALAPIFQNMMTP
ncbi:MAG: hypothetical protein GXY33_19630 [Phycisphaerae bacterium]|nr:hypothetical protein [Phycisphaerae bacterium]